MSWAKKLINGYRVEDGGNFRLKKFDPADTGKLRSKGARGRAPGQEDRPHGGTAGQTVRPGPLGIAPHLSGHACGWEGRRHQARDVCTLKIGGLHFFPRAAGGRKAPHPFFLRFL